MTARPPAGRPRPGIRGAGRPVRDQGRPVRDQRLVTAGDPAAGSPPAGSPVGRPPGADPAAGPGAAGRATKGAGASRPGGAGDVPRRASRHPGAAMAVRLLPGRTRLAGGRPGGPLAAGTRTGAGRRGPGAPGRAVVLAGGQPVGAGRAARSRSRQTRGQRGTGLLRGRGQPGRRRCRRRQSRSGRTCPFRASRPDDSPATSQTRRGAVATPRTECRADRPAVQGRRVIGNDSTEFYLSGPGPCAPIECVPAGLP